MMTLITGKPQKTHTWENRTSIKEQITRVLQTNKTEIMNKITPTNDHLQHKTVTTIMTSDLTMIVEDNLHIMAPTYVIAPAPKRTVHAPAIRGT
jgi:hypothetical protein